MPRCFSHRNQSGTIMVGLLTRSTPHPLQHFHLWQLPGGEKSGAWRRQKMEITPTKPRDNPRSKQTALHWELRVFPRPYHPPQEFPGVFTIPGTALVPKCRDKGKTRPQGAWLPALGQPCPQQEKAKLPNTVISLSFQQVGRISQAMGNTWTGTSQSTPQPHISNVPTSTGSPPAPPLPSLPNAIKTGPRFPTWCWEHL